MDQDHPYYGTPIGRGRTFTPLPWRRTRRGTPGAVWNGAHWVAPPHGLASLWVPPAGRFVGGLARVVPLRRTTPWLPYWRRPKDAPRPHEHGPRVIFRGGPSGVEVGGLS